MDEPAWSAAGEGKGFLQSEPDDGAPASVATRFHVLWDDEAIYVGIECDDTEPPTVRGGPRDEDVDADMVAVDIAPTLDNRTAYHFGVFSGGQQFDGMHIDDTGFDVDWNGTWESATHLRRHGWSVEMRIPLRIMRIPSNPQEFGLNVSRDVVRRNESEYWQHHPRGTPGGVSGYGRLTGLAGLQPKRPLELVPFLSTRMTRSLPAGAGTAPLRFLPCLQAGFNPTWSSTSCLGVDLRYPLASDLVIVAALNPDFGPVEPDRRVQNLSTYETFQPEKRPFFMQGRDLLSLPASGAWQPFYSRRIGRALSPSGGAGVLDSPAVSPVAGAFQISGTVNDTDIAAIGAYEPGAWASVLGPTGRITQQQEAVPVASSVVRVRRHVGSNLVLGALATAAEPFGAGLHAHVAEADGVLSDSNHDWSLAMQLGGSVLSGPDHLFLPDGTLLSGGSTGGAFSATVSKDGGAVIGSVSADVLTPKFTVNDLGYMARANLADVQARFGLRDLKPHAWWRSAEVELRAHEQHDFRGLLLYRKLALEGSTTFPNYWLLSVGVSGYAPTVDDRELGDGTPFERPGLLAVQGALSTDSHRMIVASISGEHDEGINSKVTSTYLGASVAVRPNPALGCSIGVDFTDVTNDIRKLRGASGLLEAHGDPRDALDPETALSSPRLYLFAPQWARSLAVQVRATAMPLPHVALQVFAQVFSAGLVWGAPLRAAVAPGAQTVELSSLRPAWISDLPPDANDSQVAMDVNLVLRWEWRVGSVVSLVYSHSSSNYLDGGRARLGNVTTLGQIDAQHLDVFFIRMDMLTIL